jgi:hypothetical protein
MNILVASARARPTLSVVKERVGVDISRCVVVEWLPGVCSGGGSASDVHSMALLLQRAACSCPWLAANAVAVGMHKQATFDPVLLTTW